MNVERIALAGLALMAAFRAEAQPATFDVRPVTVNASSRVAALALNDHGKMVGVYVDANAVDHGFILSASGATSLPPAYPSCDADCLAVPTAINNAGDVAGYGFNGGYFAFLLHQGAYLASAQTGVGDEAPPKVGLNNRGLLYFNVSSNGHAISYAGEPGAYALLSPPGRDPVIYGANDKGVLAGSGTAAGDTVFSWKPGHFVAVRPGGFDAVGGYVNDRGQVAGSYVDGLGQPHGFVYAGGLASSFMMPTAAANLHVAGINLGGRVAGSYTDTSEPSGAVQHVFLYNGSVVSVFGAYPASAVLQLAVNDNNVILVFDLVNGAAGHGIDGNFASYRAVCRGLGC